MNPGHAVSALLCAFTVTLGWATPTGAGSSSGVAVISDDLPPRGDALRFHTTTQSSAAEPGPKSRPAVPEAPRLSNAYRFISAPDFLNQDVADLTSGSRETYTDPATGRVANSTNAAYEKALDYVLSEVSTQGASDLFVAGDLMEGRWGRDDSGAGVFGPVRTFGERSRATREAAAVYYPAWSQRLAEHGLTPYPALGDHEIGDNPWSRSGDDWIDFKRAQVPMFKRLFARQLLAKRDGTRRFADRPPRGQARSTAYAVRVDPNLLLVTIDPWTRGRDDVRARVDGAQLLWLRGVLAEARRKEVPWVVVQGHTPVAGPVRERNSSGLRYRGGTSSALWRTMRRGGVDLYLCGEVHDQTVTVRDGIVQLAHGSLFYRGEASYVVGQATAERLVLENHQFRGRVNFADRLWTTSRLGAPGSVTYSQPSVITGTLQARRDARGRVDVHSITGIFRPLD